jgi:beta-N-acetylhexosaminidase
MSENNKNIKNKKRDDNVATVQKNEYKAVGARRKKKKNSLSRDQLLMITIASLLVLIVALLVVALCIAKSGKTQEVEAPDDDGVTQEEQTLTEETTQSESTQGTTKAAKDVAVSGGAVAISAEDNAKIDAILSKMTLEEKINQMFIITPEALTGVGTVVASGDATRAALKKHPVGGLIYFAQNIESESQTKEMISSLKKIASEECAVPLFVCIDEEGGQVARLGNSANINVPKVSSMPTIGASGDVNKAYEAGVTIGTYLSDYGFNLDFAPVADVITNSQNTVVKNRSFGTDADRVGQMAVKLSQGLNSKGVYSCYKHFPGHGATKDDTHEGFAYTNKTYDELAQSELKPFVTAINNGADFIMVGHISVPGVTGDNTPASLSYVVINDILKEKLGFQGIVITDSLAMGAISNYYTSSEMSVKAVEAGVDVLLMPADFNAAYNGLLSAAKSGRISQERIDQSVRKILYRKLNLK